MMQAKKYLIAAVVGVALFSIVAGMSLSQTGYFSKAFSKTVQPNQVYVENVSIRKYFNLTIRFRTSPSGSDLTFSDPDAVVVLRDSSGSQIFSATGISNGKIYSTEDNLLLESIFAADSVKIDSYADNFNQSTSISYIGTKAYLTIILSKAGGNATVVGFVYDELTNRNLPGITITAMNSTLDPSIFPSAAANQTDSIGSYILAVPSGSDGQAYDFYISDYAVSP